MRTKLATLFACVLTLSFGLAITPSAAQKDQGSPAQSEDAGEMCLGSLHANFEVDGEGPLAAPPKLSLPCLKDTH